MRIDGKVSDQFAAIDPEWKSQFGLLAEEVEKIDPELVTRDEQGGPFTVR